MASLVVHYAIAKEYAKYNQVDNFEEFLEGSLYPDTVEKSASHFSVKYYTQDPLAIFTGKVNLKAFTEKHQLDSDFNKGYFLHLLTDFVFYHEYYVKKFIKGGLAKYRNYELDKEYDKLNRPICEKYELDISLVPENLRKYFVFGQGNPPKYLVISDIVDIIDFCKNLNLDEWYEKAEYGINPVYEIKNYD